MKTEPFTLRTGRAPLGPAPAPEELLDFEATHPRPSGRKDEAIRTGLQLTPSRYYVLLHRAATSSAGQAHDPITCRRVRARITDHHRKATR